MARENAKTSAKHTPSLAKSSLFIALPRSHRFCKTVSFSRPDAVKDHKTLQSLNDLQTLPWSDFLPISPLHASISRPNQIKWYRKFLKSALLSGVFIRSPNITNGSSISCNRLFTFPILANDLRSGFTAFADNLKVRPKMVNLAAETPSASQGTPTFNRIFNRILLVSRHEDKPHQVFSLSGEKELSQTVFNFRSPLIAK
jgi:hypothetical protein